MESSNNARNLALEMGIGQFQADMVIPYMWMTPSTLDPDMPAVRVMVEAIQQQLVAMGAPHFPARGELDVATATWLRQITGPTWVNMTWGRIFGAVLNAKNAGRRLASRIATPRGAPQAVSGLPDFGDPTTLVLLGAAALLFLNRKKL